MPFQIVREPIAGPLSFARSDDAAILTQAAVLLAIGAQLRGNNKRFRVASGGPAASAAIPDEELKLLGLPPLGESLGRIDSAHNRQLLFSRAILPEAEVRAASGPDRKSTRLNSSHGYISYAVFRLQKKQTR